MSQRNAPGAIRAMALMVSPERLRVFFIWVAVGAFCWFVAILVCPRYSFVEDTVWLSFSVDDDLFFNVSSKF